MGPFILDVKIILTSNNDGTHATLAKFSQVFRSFRRFGNVFGPVRTFPDAFRHVRMRSEAFGSVRTFSEIFENFRHFLIFFALVPNTGEACDEMCAATAPIISEM